MTLILDTSSGKTMLETLRERYEREPHSKLFMPLADQLRARGDFGEAIELCMRGKAVHPDYVSCRVLLGKCLMELGMKEEARRELEEVLELDRENVFSLRVMAEILRAQGRLNEAADYYGAALRINPTDMDAQQRLAVLVRLQESPEDGGSESSESREEVRLDEPEDASAETIELDASKLAGPSEGEPSSREPVPFFNYEVRRSDFSRFARWVDEVSREGTRLQQNGGSKESGRAQKGSVEQPEEGQRSGQE